MKRIRCHTRRSIAAYLFKPAAYLRKSCFSIFARSGRYVAPSEWTQTAIDVDKSRISSQSESALQRLKIERCLVIGKAIQRFAVGVALVVNGHAGC